MTRVVAFLVLLPSLLAAEETLPIVVRGKLQALPRMRSGSTAARAAVVFLPGDGGWRGAAVRMANAVASWGYDVFGFDTRRYLEANSQNGTKLSPDNLAADMRSIAEQVGAVTRKPVVFVGWSQGAGMAIAAIADNGTRRSAEGVITLGLPESAVLGWDWKAALAVLANRDPGQPSFSVAPLLPHVAPARICMIYGSQDEYTQIDRARALFRAASEPKRLQEIAGANHRFDGHQDELFRSMREGLEWIAAR
jgi:type IV secretory pathway VirJ component